MASLVLRRLTYVALAAGTIIAGLLVHLRGSMLGATARDILGDALWAGMMFWWVSACAANARFSLRYGTAYVICAVVELSQAVHTPALDGVRATTIGQLVLGSGFDPRDFLAYALGIAAAALLDSTLVRRDRR